jgi:hypothetical protein
MKPKKLIGSVVLMFALGVALFAVIVALMQTRIGRPVTPAQSEISAGGANPAEGLSKGL